MANTSASGGHASGEGLIETEMQISTHTTSLPDSGRPSSGRDSIHSAPGAEVGPVKDEVNPALPIDDAFYLQDDPEPGFVFTYGDINGVTGYNNTHVDVVTIPCPGASPIETWTRDTDDEYVGSRLNYPKNYTPENLPGASILNPAIEGQWPKAKYSWVRQGIRERNNVARVLMYRHRELSEGLTLEHLADDLLNCLCETRNSPHHVRPLFFICHSIGGLVVKHALEKARYDKNKQWILHDCHGVTFFATPHRGSSYMSMPILRGSIRHLLQLSKPLPRSITDDLRLENDRLLNLHENFIDLASDMRIWTFYETEDSPLSGFGVSDLNEVHFKAPLASIKSTLVNSRREEAFSLESRHAVCGSFGKSNSQTKKSYIRDLSEAIKNAHELCKSSLHTPLGLTKHVKLELIGFYDDPEPDSASDVRLYVSAHSLDEFLKKGPERCLEERLNIFAPKLGRQSIMMMSTNKSSTTSGLSDLGRGLWSNVTGFKNNVTDFISGSHHRSDDIPHDQPTRGPKIKVERPSLGDLRIPATEPVTVPRRSGYKLPIPSFLESQKSSTPSVRSILRPDIGSTPRTLSEPANPVPHIMEGSSPVEPASTHNSVDTNEAQESSAADRQKSEKITDIALMQQLMAGFSRPKPEKRKFMWIHLPYTNPHWVKNIFDKLSETQQLNYSRLLRNEYWADRHVHGRHGQTHATHITPGCGFVPAEARKIDDNKAESPHPGSSRTSRRNSLAPSSYDHLYLYLPYLHFDTYTNLITRRKTMLRRISQGRARPVPKDVAELPLDHRVIWEFIGHDPPLNTRRTLDQYGYPSLRDTYARDDDQMLYKLTKEVDDKEKDPHPEGYNFFRTAMHAAGLKLKDLAALTDDEDDDVLDGNVLMVDQLWLWAVNRSTLTTFFPKRQSHPTEGAMFQQADLRNSVYNELNGDLTGRCDNALDLAAFITLHAVTVLLDRSSHPSLAIFRIFEEALGLLTERMTASLKDFRLQGSRNRRDRSDEDRFSFNKEGSHSIKRRHEQESKQAERENLENTSALLELRDMEDELSTLKTLFKQQESVINEMLRLYDSEELREFTRHGRRYLDEALCRLKEYKKQVDGMLIHIERTRTDYEKLLEIAQRKAQVDEARWSRRQAELAGRQNSSVMIFTTFTVIFLPLSFFTSLFGMNTSDWAGSEGNQYPSLRTIGSISLPTSVAIIAFTVIIAFSTRIQTVLKWEVKIPLALLKFGLSRLGIGPKRWKDKSLLSWLGLDLDSDTDIEADQSYDFWPAISRKQTEYQIPESNRRGNADALDRFLISRGKGRRD